MIAVDHRKTAGFYKLHSAEKSLRKARGVEVLGGAASYHEVDVSPTIDAVEKLLEFLPSA